MNESDMLHLRRAFVLAREARDAGNGPYGAVLVGADGSVLLEARNTVNTESDLTGHAETNLLRTAFRTFDAVALAGATLYSSAEPCPMCAGAIYWSGVGRVVFGIGIPRLSALLGEGNQAGIRCADILTTGRPVKVEGPLLEEEAALVFAS